MNESLLVLSKSITRLRSASREKREISIEHPIKLLPTNANAHCATPPNAGRHQSSRVHAIEDTSLLNRRLQTSCRRQRATGKQASVRWSTGDLFQTHPRIPVKFAIRRGGVQRKIRSATINEPPSPKKEGKKVEKESRKKSSMKSAG